MGQAQVGGSAPHAAGAGVGALEARPGTAALVPDGPTTRNGHKLVCFPCAGAGVGMFRGWQRQLGEGWETRRVRLAGREARFHDPYPRSIEEAVEELLPELGALVGGQLVLFGHSMGGLLAYEACCQLERAGRPVDGLVVAATAAPVGPAPWREGQERFEEIAPTGDDDQGTDEMRALMRSTLRRDVALCLRYTERTQRVAAPLLVLQGSHDPFVSDASSARWRALAAGEVGFRTFEGGHHFVLDRSREIAALLRGVGRLPVAAGEQDR